jgi:SAM-dependent methyltransferase
MSSKPHLFTTVPFMQTPCDTRLYAGCNPPLLDVVRSLRPGRALDCGCGAGGNAERMRDMGWSVTGITVSVLERDAASSACMQLCVADLNNGIPSEIPGPFELVVLSHVLEHLLNPTNVLRDAHERLAPGGRLLVALPNVLYWRFRLKYLLGSFEYETAGILDETHLHFYTFRSAMTLLQEHGYHIDLALGAGTAPLPIIRRVLPYVASHVDSVASRLLPGLCGEQLLFLARSSYRPPGRPAAYA